MHTCEKLLLNVTSINLSGAVLTDQAIAISEGLISWCGAQKDLPDDYLLYAKEKIDCQGKLVTPGLIDCHTHLVYAGNRLVDFQLKLDGLSYSEIAKKGGGILSTVRQTRAASEEQLLVESLPRLNALAKEGVTTVEIKSGYGLDLENELKMLRVARRLGDLTGLRIRTTFLGAHAIGPEFQGNSQSYVDYVCAEMLPAVKEEGLADAVDVFCESIAFSVKQTELIFMKASELRLPVKCHAEQLSTIGASVLAAKYKALSCDHLEFIDEEGIKAISEASTVAVLLPGAYYFLCEQQKPPVELLRQAGVGMAIATDSNPGSSPTTSLLLMMHMACHFFGMTVNEVMAAVTYQAARALGLEGEIGSISTGLQADLLLWPISNPTAFCYYFASPCSPKVMIAGKWKID